jgi:transposase
MAERRTFTLEFKREAVRLVTERKLSVPEAARQLGVGPNLLRKWRRALEAGGKQGSSEKKDQTALEEEVRRLRVENERLRMERDLLKKATVFFAKESR